VYWNGAPRTTTVVNSSEVVAAIPASDLIMGAEITVATVQVVNGGGQASNPLPFSIVAQTVGTVDTSVAASGGTAAVSTAPTTAGDAGVAVVVQNNGGEPLSVVAATYDTKPAGETAFRIDNGDFVDVQINGADSTDVATVYFYYPSTITGNKEDKVKLRYFDGVNLITVLSSGGVLPVKDPTDNLDGTQSGGRFVVAFDNTSTPKITELNGTIFGMIDTTPQILSVSGPTGPLALGSSASLTVNYATPDAAQTCQVGLAWDDGSNSTATGNNGVATASHMFAGAGVYSVTVTVQDADGAVVSTKFEYVVIYDPSAGFVTGGGWINSPPGAYVADPSLTGKANFGFVSKYLKGRTVPTGETEFQFHAASFQFNSAVYEWLVVSGALAQYKGSGTISGAGDFGFLLTATDGQITGGGAVDKFRIKIWNKATGALVYDNAMGSSDDINSANPQAIGGGSIVIQKAK